MYYIRQQYRHRGRTRPDYFCPADSEILEWHFLILAIRGIEEEIIKNFTHRINLDAVLECGIYLNKNAF